MGKDILSHFAGVHAAGAGYMARCPAHDDRKASLKIDTGDDGKWLLMCHAKCPLEAILAAAHLEIADLFPDTATRTKNQIVATYPYHDEGGAHLYDVVRFAPKDFRQRRADGVWKMNGVRRVLYRLPELQGQTIAYVVEGEKDADRLRAIGLPGTTNAAGAGKWRQEYTAQLQAASVESVVILPDNDDPGRQHAAMVAASCHAAGLKVKIIALPDLPDKGDVSDWLDAGHSKDELIALRQATALYEPTEADQVRNLPDRATELELTGLSDLLAEPDETVDYLVEDRIHCGSVDILAGKPKAGKSTAARGLALEVARGGTWLGFACLPRPVWYLALEDKRSEVRRHFRLMGATGAEPVRFLFRQPTDDLMARLHALASREHPGLIIVDTLQRLIRAQDLNDYAEVTTKLTPILRLARETGAAVLLLHHAGKSERAGIDAVLGSTALTGSVDNVFILSRTDRFRVLSSVQRIGPDLPETVILLDPETGRVRAGATRHDADRDSVATAILAALEADSPQTEARLETTVEGRTGLKREALRTLLQTGRVIRHGRGGKKDPFHYSIPVPEAGNNKTDTADRALDSGSCSLVPTIGWEQQNMNRGFHESLNTYGPDSCSHVPGTTVPASLDREHAFSEARKETDDAGLDY